MPLLGRLFAKKNKVSPRAEILDDDNAHSPTFAPTTTVSNDSNHTASSYVTPDINVPSHPNAKSLLHLGRGREQGSTTPVTSGGGGLRFFRRKKSSIPTPELLASSASDVNSRTAFDSPQRSVLSLSRTSDVGKDPTELRRQRPPLSRSAIFAAYADNGSSFSTRSLPESTLRSSSPQSPASPSPSPALPQKRPSLLAWAKPLSHSSSNTGSNVDVSLRTPSERSDSPGDWNSFNLKSFRHIGSASPNQREVCLSPPIPRPRGTSMHSDSSQRISVAAFREAQARRSQTGSPVPSPIDSSLPSIPSASSPVIKSEGRHPGHGPRYSRSSAALVDSRQRRSSIVVPSTSETDSDGESIYNGKSRQLPGRKAQSELGHGSMVTESSFKRANALAQASRASRSNLGHGHSSSASRPLTNYGEVLKRPEFSRRSQSSLGLYESSNKLVATASRTSLNTSVPGHKQNPSVSSNATLSTARKVTPPQTTSSQQAAMGKVNPPPRNSDSDSEDNAPLSSLIAPKRPGSAMSSYSNSRSVSGQTTRTVGHAKPLIDVNEVISSKPASVSSPPPSDAAFTQGLTLLSTAAKITQVTHGSSPLAPNPKLADDDCQPLTRKVPPASSPAKELVNLSLDESVTLEKNSEVLPSAPVSLQRESSPDQKRDPLSDRLTRVVKKSLTNPMKTPEVASNSLWVATSSESLQTRHAYEASRIILPRSPPPIIQPSKDEYSPPDEDLAKLLGSAGIKLISRTGDPDETSDSESSEEEEEEERGKDEDRIAPIPIKQRAPPPAFAVTSRPALPKQQAQGSISSPPAEVKSLPGQVNRKTPVMTQGSDFPTVRQRSSTMIPSSSSSSFPSTNAPPSARDSKASTDLTSPSTTDISSKSASSNGHTGVSIEVAKTASVRPVVGVRQKSHTMITGVPLSSQMSRHSNAPDRRFATVRGDSPSSSTGDSSSGRAPHTPRDSGEMYVPEDREQKQVLLTTNTEERSRGGIKRQNAHPKRRSVSFEDDVLGPDTTSSKSHTREAATVGSGAIGSGRGHVRETAKAGPDGDSSDEEVKVKVKVNEKEKVKEEKRRERRRKEAQAAIELGNVMHGPPPVLDDDNNDMPTNPTMNPRLSTFNPMMGMNPLGMAMNYTPSPGPGGWAPNMLSPSQFMIPPPSDPNLMAAHQQAMMVAKQAYQMAVAQHAMAAAAEEWERGSALGGFGSGSSIYGGTSPSMINGASTMMPHMSMPGMQGHPAGAMWPGSSSLYGGMGAMSRFGNYLSPGDMPFSSSRSDHGAGARTSGNWNSSRSMYGESFRPSDESFSRETPAPQHQSARQAWNTGRDSTHFPPVPPIPASKNTSGRGSPDPRGPSRLRTISQPARSSFARKAMPPSSWRPSGS